MGQTVLAFLAQNYSHSTESDWQSRLEAREVLLNERTVNGHEQLGAGDALVWNRPGWLEEATPQTFELIYRDEQLVVVDKPSGLPTIPGGGFYQNTLLSFVQREYPTARPLHRLGRATSGLVLFALDSQSASIMSKNWCQVQKQYLALSQSISEQECYDIHCPIGEQWHPRLGKVYAASASGKRAHSVARVLERRTADTLFEVDLHTGRPHQIRIHLAYIGHPLVGDPLYAVGGLPRIEHPGLPGDGGYFLHAKRLVFQHPVTGEPIEVNGTVPEILRWT